MPGHPAYPDKGIMRVHASLRDDIRLWGSAVAGALVLFTVIVVLGIGPSRFPSFGTGHPRASRTVVVPQDGSTVTPAHRPTSSSSASHAAKPKHNVPATGNNAAVAQPRSGPSAQRPTPSPVKPTQTPDRTTAPSPASVPAAEAPMLPPAVPLPSPPDPIVPTLPTVTLPPLPSLPSLPTDAAPAVPLP